jgi:DNA-binding NarL/FixJ family response regulator
MTGMISRLVHDHRPKTSPSSPPPDLPRIRVFIIVTHNLVREALGAVIQTHPRLCLVGEAGGFHQACEDLPDCAPEVAVVDADLDDGDGAELVARLRKARRSLAWGALGAAAEIGWIQAMVRSGAHGCVSKAANRDRLLRAILAAHEGERYFCPQALEVLMPILLQVRRAEEPRQSDPSLLTPRERQVAQLLATGDNVKAIAAGLGISAKTVETHRKNLMTKLGLDSVAGLVHYAMRSGLLDTTTE